MNDITQTIIGVIYTIIPILAILYYYNALWEYNTFRSFGQIMLVEGDTLLEVIFQYHYNGILW